MKPVISYISPSIADQGSEDVSVSIFGDNFDANTVISVGGQNINARFFSNSMMTTTIQSSVLANPSLGGITVIASNSDGKSNPAIFSVIPNSPITLSDLDVISVGTNAPITDLIEQPRSEYINNINGVKTYIVRSDDTLQGIAENMLGDANRWMDIAFINNLRYPYISDDVSSTAGTNNLTVNLTKNAVVGSTTVYLNSWSKFIESGAILFFSIPNQFATSNLDQLSDVVEISDTKVSPNSYSVQVNLTQPLQNNYPVGTKVNILSTYNNTTSRVVGTGQTILIPYDSQNESIVKSSNMDINDPFLFLGSDILLDSNGGLSVDGNGDISNVAGLNNLGQALYNRMRTYLGELNYHPVYGNPLLDYIGTLNGPNLALMSNHRIIASIIQDPRVDAVESITSSVIDDRLDVRTEISISTVNDSTQFNFILSGK